MTKKYNIELCEIFNMYKIVLLNFASLMFRRDFNLDHYIETDLSTSSTLLSHFICLVNMTLRIQNYDNSFISGVPTHKYRNIVRMKQLFYTCNCLLNDMFYLTGSMYSVLNNTF